MRFVEERSLSSILRSKLLTILRNNDVSGKVNANGCAKALDKFHWTAVITYTCHACFLAAVDRSAQRSRTFSRIGDRQLLTLD